MKLNPNGIWNPYIPTDHDVQVSHIADMQACGAYSIVHKGIIRTKFLTGIEWQFSERAQATLSGTTPQGNSLENEITAIKNIGLILNQDWPELLFSTDYQNITWAEYYTSIPEAIQKKAFKFDLTPLTQLTTPAQVTAALKQDTTWVIIKTSGGENHIVVRLNQFLGQWGLGQYYDSYEVVVKDFQPSEPIVSEWSLILTPKIMTNVYTILRTMKDGTKELAFGLPATSETAGIDKALNLGLPIPTLNNGKNIDWANFTPTYSVNE